MSEGVLFWESHGWKNIAEDSIRAGVLEDGVKNITEKNHLKGILGRFY